MDKQNYSQTEMIVRMIHEGHSLEELAKTTKLPSLASCLNEMMGRKRMTVEAAAGLADLNTATVHKIMAHKINPTRNTLLRLALALEASFDETQILLKSGNCAALSGSRQRDLYIIDGIESKKTFDVVNEALRAHGFLDLYSKG